MWSFFRREQLHIDLQMVVMATFIVLWTGTESAAQSKDCGWRNALTCSACGADFEFECSGSCSLLVQHASPAETATPSCCGGVLLSSQGTGLRERQGNRLGAYKLIETECQGRPVYQHYSQYLFYKSDSWHSGWRVSNELCGTAYGIRQKNASLDLPCPADVANWEYYNSGVLQQWKEGDLSIDCAQPTPPNSTCTEPISSGGLPSWLVWIGAVALSCGARALCSYVRARRRRQTVANDNDAEHSMTAPEKHLSLAIAIASLTFIVVYFTELHARSKATTTTKANQATSTLAVQWGCTLVLAVQLGCLFYWHDTLVVLRRRQRCAYALCSFSLMLWYLAIFLIATTVTMAAYDGMDTGKVVGIGLTVGLLTAILTPIAYSAWQNRLKLHHLASLDDRLADTLASGAIRLLDAEVLRSGALERIERRQDFEARQAAGEHLFVQPDQAVRMLKAGRRQIGFLTYGWRTSDHPDPDNKTLHAVVSALRSEEGAHITAIFWDCPCLWQSPRTPDQNAEFKQGLAVMADGYASPLGVTVLRRTLIPPLPEELTGRVVLFGVEASLPEQRIRTALIGRGRTLTELWFELDRAPPGVETPSETGRWHARFASHEQAAEAVDELQELPEGANGAGLWYNERAYTNRGWCVFESFVSTEALIRIDAHPRLKSHLRSMKLPPKLLEVDGGSPVPVQPELNETVKERVERMRLALTTAAFTGKADRATVIKMLETYIDRITAAIYLSGEGGGAQYRGEYNSSGQCEGHGILRCAAGRYEGGFVAGKWHGPGVFLCIKTNRTFEGEWIDGRMNGPFICKWDCSKAIAASDPVRKFELCRFNNGSQYGISVKCTETLEGRSMRRHWESPLWLTIISAIIGDDIMMHLKKRIARALPSSCPDAVSEALPQLMSIAIFVAIIVLLSPVMYPVLLLDGTIRLVLNRCCASISDESGREIARRIGATMPEDYDGVELVVVEAMHGS